MTETERAHRLVEQAKREPYYSELEAEVARLTESLRLANAYIARLQATVNDLLRPKTEAR